MAKGTVTRRRSSGKPVSIYGLIDPETQQLRYVGKTVANLDKRYKNHLSEAARLNGRHTHHWIVGLVRRGLAPRMTLIEEVQAGADWVEAEQFWITYFRGLGCRLTNLCGGGQGTDGYVFTPEQRQRLSDAHKGLRLSPESEAKKARTYRAKKAAGWVKPTPSPESIQRANATRARLLAEGKIKTRKGVPSSTETRARMSAAQKALLTPEHRKYLGDIRRGKPITPKGRANMRAAQQARRDAERDAGKVIKYTGQALENMREGWRRRSERQRAEREGKSK